MNPVRSLARALGASPKDFGGATSNGMNFNRLKELARKVGMVLVFDGDEPSFVVLTYDKFQKLDTSEEVPVSNRRFFNESNESGIADGIDFEQGRGNSLRVPVSYESDDEVAVERLNQEILALKEEIKQKEESELVGNGQSTEQIAEAVDFD